MSEIYKKYDVLIEIGSGGFSRVYKASPLNDPETYVAIKVVRTREQDCELKSVAENEVAVLQTVATLNEFKDNFLQLYEVFREPRRISMVTEYLDGGELFDRVLARKKYSEYDAAQVLKTIVKALNAMHKAGIVHRDIKPENLVYARKDSDEGLKIMDFGLAYFVGTKDPHQSAVYVGTPGYISPEVITSSIYTPAADIWAMGVILYILLSGRMPFAGRTSSIMQTRVITGTFRMQGPTWDNISKRAKDLIKRMLTVDHDKRITAEGILSHSWLVETQVKSAYANLSLTLTKLRSFQERQKIAEDIKASFHQSVSDLRQKLLNAVAKTNPTGLSLGDISKVKQAFVDEKRGMQNPEITREGFKETLKKIGLKSLPADTIFDAIVLERQKHSAQLHNIAGLSLVASNKNIDDGKEKDKDKDKNSMKNKATLSDIEKSKSLAREVSVIKLDELLIGLSTVAAMESSETFLRFLFNMFSPAPASVDSESIESSKKAKDKKGEKKVNNLSKLFLKKGSPGITTTGFSKIAKVLASYRNTTETEEEGKNKLGEKLAQLFSFNLFYKDVDDTDSDFDENEQDKDVEGSIIESESKSSKPKFVSFEEFNAGVSKLSKDLFDEYFHPQLSKLGQKIEQYSSNSENGTVKKTLNYLRRMGSYIEEVGDKWNKKKQNNKNSKVQVSHTSEIEVETQSEEEKEDEEEELAELKKHDI